MAAGTYFLRTFNLQGYIDEAFDDLTCAPCNLLSSSGVTVTAGATATGKDFVLAKGGLVSGYVTDATTNEPLVGFNAVAGTTYRIAIEPFSTNEGGNTQLRYGYADAVSLTGANTSVLEGNAGTTVVLTSLALSSPAETTVTANLSTLDGTATAPSDYVAGTQTVTFAPGEVAKLYGVSVVGDTTAEPSETFTVTPSSVTNATAGALPVFTITNDDSAALCDGQVPTIVGSGVITGTSGNDVILGSAGADTINGNGGNDRICAGGGADMINGGGGLDRIFGQAGNDTINEANAQNGADVLDGGADIDLVNYGGRTAAITVRINATADDGAAGEGDRVANIEKVTTGTGADTIVGGTAAETLNGGGNSDSINGGGGSDIIGGGGGIDTIVAGPGADSVNGGDGNDVINLVDGVSGNDSANGGPGTDTATRDPGDTLTNVP